MSRQNFRYPSILIGSCFLLAPGEVDAAQKPRQEAFFISAESPWTDTGLDMSPGKAFHIQAEGTIRAVGLRLTEWLFALEVDRSLGPEGTYVWPRRYRPRSRVGTSSFPLPAMAEGPFPAFCLIGKIGESGGAFYVGASFDGVAREGGRLWLGINDDYFPDNSGRFRVKIQMASKGPEPAAEPRMIEPHDPVIAPPHVRIRSVKPNESAGGGLVKQGQGGGRDVAPIGAKLQVSRALPVGLHTGGGPVAGARVLLLYVDGLRPDVLQEMAAGGFLPHFKSTFIDGGLAVPEAFTVFPSNTLIANGSLFTGLFSDATGLKSQNQFERSSLKSTGQLSRWLPDGFISQPKTRILNLLDKYAPENTHSFLVWRGAPTLGTRLGKAYAFTTLPIAPLNPPPYWFHRAVNTIGPIDVSRRLSEALDVVNAQYALEDLIGNADARVIAVWLPMVDKTSHHSPRGQFGAARRDLALADRYLGRILQRLRGVGWERSTYLILVSDHGHMGGEPASLPASACRPQENAGPFLSSRCASPTSSPKIGQGINRRCNLPRDWAHRKLGCNSKVVGEEWMHPGIDSNRFFFFDNQGAGQAKLFLPRGSYFRGSWRRNRLFELEHYELRPGQTLNLLESLADFRPAEWEEGSSPPVDLILVKLDEQRTLVYRGSDNQAIIHRQSDAAGGETYRYEPLRRLTQSEDGSLHFERPLPGIDPLGYLKSPEVLEAAGGRSWFEASRSSREWLSVTARSRYPDAVVAIAKFFAWRGPVADLGPVRDPDLVVTASEGWSFRSDEGWGTDHGYPLAPSMRMTLFFSGPNIARGILRTPQRIVDVLPTVLDMVRWPYDPERLDGEAIRGIYR